MELLIKGDHRDPYEGTNILRPKQQREETIIDGVYRAILDPRVRNRIELAPGAYKLTFQRDGEILRQPGVALAPGEELAIGPDLPALALLPLVEPLRDCIGGTARWEGETLHFEAPSGERAVLQIPIVPPREYSMRLKVERTSGQESFGVGLPAAEGRFLAVFDDQDGDQAYCGIMQSRGGKPLFEPRSEGALLPLGKTVELEIAVEADSVRLVADGRTVVDWSGNPESLALLPSQAARYSGILFLHNFESGFRVHELTLISGTARRLLLSGPQASPHRLAAERALWKGGRVRLEIVDKVSPYVDNLDDLPAAPTLYGFYPRDSNVGLAFEDHDLSLVEGLTSIRDVGLNHSRVTDRGLAHLAGLTGIEWLILSNSLVTDDGLAHLRNLPKVKTLFLLGTSVGDAGMGHLRGMTQLDRVGMSNTQVGDEGIATLSAALGQARWVCFCNTRMTGASLAHLAKLPKLETLHTGQVQIADADLPPLYGMPSLKEVRLTGTQVTDPGKAELQQQKPGIKLLP
jgi:hypothetical protein